MKGNGFQDEMGSDYRPGQLGYWKSAHREKTCLQGITGESASPSPDHPAGAGPGAACKEFCTMQGGRYAHDTPPAVSKIVYIV